MTHVRPCQPCCSYGPIRPKLAKHLLIVDLSRRSGCSGTPVRSMRPLSLTGIAGAAFRLDVDQPASPIISSSSAERNRSTFSFEKTSGGRILSTFAAGPATLMRTRRARKPLTMHRPRDRQHSGRAYRGSCCHIGVRRHPERSAQSGIAATTWSDRGRYRIGRWRDRARRTSGTGGDGRTVSGLRPRPGWSEH